MLSHGFDCVLNLITFITFFGSQHIIQCTVPYTECVLYDDVDKLFVKELQTIYYGIQIINSFPFFVLLFLKEQKCWITKSLSRMFSTKESNLTKPGFLLDFQSFSMYLLLFRSGREVSRLYIEAKSCLHRQTLRPHSGVNTFGNEQFARKWTLDWDMEI